MKKNVEIGAVVRSKSSVTLVGKIISSYLPHEKPGIVIVEWGDGSLSKIHIDNLYINDLSLEEDFKKLSQQISTLNQAATEITQIIWKYNLSLDKYCEEAGLSLSSLADISHY